MAGPRITEVSLTPEPVFASAGGNPVLPAMTLSLALGVMARLQVWLQSFLLALGTYLVNVYSVFKVPLRVSPDLWKKSPQVVADEKAEIITRFQKKLKKVFRHRKRPHSS